jgi:SSS family solute:Na+ symporter
MVLIVVAITAMVTVLLVRIPVSPGDALHLAGATGRLRVFDFSFSLKNTYTFWSGMIGGTFLMLSYFGTDQSQVQRYLTARSVNEARNSLLISAYWKIPLQAAILLIGVLVFVFYQFVAPPLLFNPVQEAKVRDANPAALATLHARYETVVAARLTAAQSVSAARHAGDYEALVATAAFRTSDSAVTSVRAEALSLVEKTTGQPSKDVNYIIPRFVVEQLPIGLAGLFIAGVMAAAMSAIAAELNSLATSTVIDFYRRWYRKEASDAHYLAVSRGATAMWGVFACIVATYAATLGSLIEVVNRFGSIFYGSILGVFLLAMIPSAGATGAFIGLIAGMAAVGAVNFGAPQVAFLWHNVVGAVVVVSVGMLAGLFRRGTPRSVSPTV